MKKICLIAIALLGFTAMQAQTDQSKKATTTISETQKKEQSTMTQSQMERDNTATPSTKQNKMKKKAKADAKSTAPVTTEGTPTRKTGVEPGNDNSTTSPGSGSSAINGANENYTATPAK